MTHFYLATETAETLESFQVLSDSPGCVHQDSFLHLSHKGYLSSTFENYSDDGWHCHHLGCMAPADKSLLVPKRHLKENAMCAIWYLPLYTVKVIIILKVAITIFVNIALTSREPCGLGCSCRYPPCCCYRTHFPACYCSQRIPAWAVTLITANHPDSWEIQL